MQYHKPRMRKVRILATLGPASDTPEMIEKLFRAGADAFRINMSHGDQAAKADLVRAIRSIEDKTGRPTTILVDLQGPKLRIGTFANGSEMLEVGASFVLDRDPTRPGDETRVLAASRNFRWKSRQVEIAHQRRQSGAAGTRGDRMTTVVSGWRDVVRS